MTGTPKGGKLAAEQNRIRHGSDFYKRIGAKGGSLSKGGFAVKVWCDNPCPYDEIFGDHLIVQCAGAKGGTKSRRRPKAI